MNNLIDIVNQKDEILGQSTRKEKFARGYISRNVGIFLINKSGKFVITKRGANKSVCPNMYDVSAFGMVDAGEDYEEAAKRELKEELDIDAEIEFVGKFFNEWEDGGRKYRYFTGIFLVKSNDDVKLNDELSGYEEWSFEELDTELSLHPESFTPSFGKEFEMVKKFVQK